MLVHNKFSSTCTSLIIVEPLPRTAAIDEGNAMASADYSILVSVLGPNSHGPIFHSTMEGMGKSCLCCRFIHPAVDDYIADHPSLLALHEYESHVVATEPFLYWGNRVMEFDNRSSKVRVNLEVVEHTVFYHDETSRPFPGLLKLLSPLDLAKNVSRVPESSRKLSYYSRDLIGFSESYQCKGYPSSPQRLPRVFVLTIDVSRTPGIFGSQLAALETMAVKLKKFPTVLAATKRDIANTESLRRLQEWAGKIKLPLMETSAKDGINISELFRVAAAKGLQRKTKSIPDFVNSYADASGQVLANTVRERNLFASYLAKRVQSSEATLSLVGGSEEYKMAVVALGKYAVDEIFAMHLLKLRNDEVGKYAGVKDDADMRLEFLEDYIETMDSDLTIHASSLRSFASHLAEQSAKEEEQKSQLTPKSESLTAPLLQNLDSNMVECDETDKGLTPGYVKFDSPQPSRASTLPRKHSQKSSKLMPPPPPVRNGSKLTTVPPPNQVVNNALETASARDGWLQYHSSGGSHSMDDIQSLPALAFKSAHTGVRRQSEPVDSEKKSPSIQQPFQIKETEPDVNGAKTAKPLPVPSPKPSRSKTNYQKLPTPNDGSTKPSPPVPSSNFSKPTRKSFSLKTSPSHSARTAPASAATPASSSPTHRPFHPPPPPSSHTLPPLSHPKPTSSQLPQSNPLLMSPSHSPSPRPFRPFLQPPSPSNVGLQNAPSTVRPLPAIQHPPSLYPPPPESPPPSPPQFAGSRNQPPIPAKKPGSYSHTSDTPSKAAYQGVQSHTPKLDKLKENLLQQSSHSTNSSQSSNIPLVPQTGLPQNPALPVPPTVSVSSVGQALFSGMPPPIPARPCKHKSSTPLKSHRHESSQSGQNHSRLVSTTVSHPVPELSKTQSPSSPPSPSSHKSKDTTGSPVHQQVHEDSPPPLPPRTVEMLQDVSPKHSKTKKKGMSYVNCSPKSKKQESIDKEKDKTETPVVEVMPATTPIRRTFINMKKRPLPEEPDQKISSVNNGDEDDDDDDSYEKVTLQGNPYIKSRPVVSSPQPVRHNRPAQELPPAPRFLPPPPPSDSSPTRHTPQTTAPAIVPITPKQAPFPTSRPLPLPSSSKSQSQPKQTEPADDENGYVEIDEWLHNSKPAADTRVQNVEYDYPEVRGCTKSRPSRPAADQATRPQNISQTKTPPRKQQKSKTLSSDEDYTNMSFSAEYENGPNQVVDEDVYQNAEFIRKEEKQQRRHSLDLTIYMNLPDEIVDKIGQSFNKPPVKRKLPPRVLRGTARDKQDKPSHLNPLSQPSSPKKVLSRRSSFDDVYMNLASFAANSRPLPPRSKEALIDEIYMNLSGILNDEKAFRHQGHPRGSLSSQESTEGDEAHAPPVRTKKTIALPPRRLRQQKDGYLTVTN